MSDNTFPRPITFDEIRVGDRIRRHWIGPDGDLTIEEGTVRRLTDRFVVVTGGRTVGRDFLGVLTLLDRKPKHDPLAAAPGTHWRDPEKGSCYVRTDTKSLAFAAYKGAVEYLAPWHDDEIISRLVPVRDITDEMVQRACDAWLSEDSSMTSIFAMRAALEAALNGGAE